jgi:hypothetical protein
MGQFMKENISHLFMAGFLQHLQWQEQSGSDESKKAGTPNLSTWHNRNEGLDTRLCLAFFEELKYRLVDQRRFPLDNPPEGKVAHQKICPDYHCAGQP